MAAKKLGWTTTLPRKLVRYLERWSLLAPASRRIRHAVRVGQYKIRETPYGFRLFARDDMVAGSFEPEETRLIRCRLDLADVFVDVGANIGYYTCLARRSGAHTIAVEPLRENLDFLYANLQANGWDDVEVYPVGLSSHAGVSTLYGVETGASLVRGWAGTSAALHQLVPISTLDILLGERFRGKRPLIKVDVEGSEYELLLGAGKTLSMVPPPVWIVEIGLTEHHPLGINPNFVATFELFWEAGYRAYTADGKLTPLTPADVSSWAASRVRGFGSENYIFASSSPG